MVKEDHPPSAPALPDEPPRLARVATGGGGLGGLVRAGHGNASQDRIVGILAIESAPRATEFVGTGK